MVLPLEIKRSICKWLKRLSLSTTCQFYHFMGAIDKLADNLLKKSDTFWIALLSLLTFFMYHDVLFGHQFLTFDDNWYIYENKNVIALSWQSVTNIFTGIQGGQYSPIGEFYHALIYHFFGNNTTAFKLFALLTHIANAGLVFKLMGKLSENKWLPVFVAFVFALHPMQVEITTWMSAIFRIAVMFMLVGYLFYTRYLERGFKWTYLLPVLLFFILALLTKEQAILFPIGLVLINLKKGHNLFEKRSIIDTMVFGAISFAFGLIVIEITKTGGPSLIGTSGSLAQRLYLLSYTFLEYVTHFIWPFNLSFLYPYPNISNWSLSGKLFEVITAITILILLGLGSIKNKEIRFGTLWSLGFLSLAFSFSIFHMRDFFMADRYVYMAIIGWAFILFECLRYVSENLLKRNRIYNFAAFFFVVLLGYNTLQRVPVFKNSKTVWSNAIKVDPNNPFARNSLGYYYKNSEKDLDSALANYQIAIENKPNFYLAQNNLSKVYYEKGNLKKALEHSSLAIKYNPTYASAYLNRAAVNMKLKRYQGAVEDLTFLISHDSMNTRFIFNRAKSNFELKNYDGSIKDCLKLLKIKNNHHSAIHLLGRNQYSLKQYEASEKTLSAAIQLSKGKGAYYYDRFLTRLLLGKTKLAVNDLVKAKEYGHPVNDNLYKKLTGLILK